MNRAPFVTSFVNTQSLLASGLTVEMIVGGVKYTHEILDMIDDKLLSAGAPRLANMVELANLSSIVGNLLGSGIAKASEGVFRRNRPHKYPDLLAQHQAASDIEIKVALEKNKPKGHLAKPGYYLTCRYVLCDASGNYVLGNEARGDVVWIWEIRFGQLNENDFSLSNTPGDSGKTAVINAEGMSKLLIVYADLERCPHPKTGKGFKQYRLLYPQSRLF